MKKINNKLIGVIFGAAAVAGITYFLTFQYYKREIEFGKNNEQLLNVYENVEQNFYLDTDTEQMTYNMISGLINGLDDRYSFYQTWNVYIENSVNNSATLLSSGFQIDKDKTGNILVTQVTENSQAEKMGLKSGDIITDINGLNVIDTGYYEIIEKLMGKDYTSMKLNIVRDNSDMEIDFIRRNIIEDYSDIKYKMIDDDTLYYKFDSFNQSTVGNFERAVSESGKDKIKNLIFDLRENRGGVDSDCIALFDLFSDSGNCFKNVYSKSGEVEIWETSDGIKYNFNVVLLVSGETLSCGEIFPLFFQDSGLGTVVGTQTGGKGVFQLKTMLDDFTSYSIVAGYYYVNDLPNYNNIGITPDIVVPMDNALIGTDDDIQLKKALEIFEK